MMLRSSRRGLEAAGWLGPTGWNRAVLEQGGCIPPKARRHYAVACGCRDGRQQGRRQEGQYPRFAAAGAAASQVPEEW
ncbi:MAG: hypothetical protein M0R02_12570 [Bacteroidales bacterium]|nr:hypothetical protein [Bacteroidales bacterium]